MAYRDGTGWLAFLNTVRTEHFDQVLALRQILPAITHDPGQPAASERASAAVQVRAMPSDPTC